MKLEQKGIIGIDIGSDQIKIVKIDKNGMVSQWAIDSTPRDSIANDRIVDLELLATYLRKLIKDKKIKGKRCSLCLPSQHIITKIISLPAMEKDILKENIYYDLEGYLPSDLGQYSIDYRILETSMINGVEYWSVLTTAISKEILLVYIETLRNAGLQPIYVDAPFNCLQKFLIKFACHDQKLILDSANYCFMDIGTASINIILFFNGKYFVDKTIYLENMSLDQIKEEVMSAVRYFKNNTSIYNDINRIVLFGGGSARLNSIQLLENEVGMRITFYNHWIDLNNKNIGRLRRDEVLLLGNAIGSTIRRVSL